MNNRIFLKGIRVSFIKPSLRDWEDILSKYDLETQQYLGIGGKFVFNEEIIKSFYDRAIEKMKNKTDFYFTVVNESNQLIGLVSIHIKEHEVGSIGYTILKEFRGKGYGTETLKLACFYAFEILGLRKIVNEVFEFNKISKYIHEKIGFRRVGILYRHIKHMGRYIDIVIYELLKEDFKLVEKEYIETVREINKILV